MINFSRLNLVEGTEAVDAAASSAEKAKSGGEKQINDTQRRKDRQKSQMSQPTSTDTKSDVTYASEGYVDSKYSPKALTNKMAKAGHSDIFLDRKKQERGKGDDVRVPIRARDSKGKEYDTNLGQGGTTGGRFSGGDKYGPSMETGGFQDAKKKLDDIDKARKVTNRDIKDARKREGRAAETRRRMDKAGRRMIRGRGKAELAKMVGKSKQNVQGKGSKAMDRATRKEEYEYVNNLHKQSSDWRRELTEKFKDDPQMHPYVDVMPFMNQKADELKRQMKDAAKMQGMKQAKMAEGASNPFQVHFDKDGKSYTSKGSKESRDRITRNIASNRKSGPLAKDPYRARAGESD